MKKSSILLCLIALMTMMSAFAQESSSKNRRKAESICETARKQFSRGRISADSMINLALYHKIWSPEVAERCLKPVAAKGNLRGMTELGALYTANPAFEAKKADGVKLLEGAVQGGYNDANAYLARYYYNQKDYKRALAYLRACKPIHYGFGFLALGNMYRDGLGLQKDYKKARENYQKSARLGSSRGMALYGDLLTTRSGGATSFPDAFFWHYIAGDLGENYSRVKLFLPIEVDEEPSGAVHRDALMALQLIEAVQSVKKITDEPIYKEGFLAGLKAKEQAAEQGDDWARFYLGSMNYHGDFLEQNFARALYYYEPIAKNATLPHNLLAVVNERLAQMYADGEGVKASKSKAAQYARAAARYGSLAAYKEVEEIR